MSRWWSIESVDDEPLALDRSVPDLAEPESQQTTDLRPRRRELDQYVREAEPPERFLEEDVEDLVAVSPESGGKHKGDGCAGVVGLDPAPACEVAVDEDRLGPEAVLLRDGLLPRDPVAELVRAHRFGIGQGHVAIHLWIGEQSQ